MRSLKITPNTLTTRSSSVARYFVEVSKEKQLTQDEEFELAFLSRCGDLVAREKLVRANLRFVISVAKKYDGFSNLSLDDLISEGNLGLAKAAERFDETKGFKFISYAVWWIRQTIIVALQNSSMIRIPQNKAQEFKKAKDTFSLLERELGREPSTDEIVDYMYENLPQEEQQQKNIVVRLRKSVASSMVSQNHLSLTSPMSSDEEGGTLLDVLEDHDNVSAYDLMNNLDDKRIVSRAMSSLSDRDSYVIDMLFGLSSGQPKEMDEVASELSLSKERVRQIREKSLRTMKFKLKQKQK